MIPLKPSLLRSGIASRRRWSLCGISGPRICRLGWRAPPTGTSASRPSAFWTWPAVWWTWTPAILALPEAPRPAALRSARHLRRLSACKFVKKISALQIGGRTAPCIWYRSNHQGYIRLNYAKLIRIVRLYLFYVIAYFTTVLRVSDDLLIFEPPKRSA